MKSVYIEFQQIVYCIFNWLVDGVSLQKKIKIIEKRGVAGLALHNKLVLVIANNGEHYMKTIKTISLISATAAALLMAGCSSNPAQQYAEIKQAEQKQVVEKKEQEYNAIPDWFLSPPKNDDTGIYAVGTATSTNLQHTLNHAKLNAEFDLAKTLSQEVSGRERAFSRSDSAGNVVSDAETVITKFVDSADIVGVETVDKEVVVADGKYTVYTMIHLSYEQQAKILSRKADNSTRIEAKNAYKEVEAEVKRRAELRKIEADAAKAEAAEAKVRASLAQTASNVTSDAGNVAGGVVEAVKDQI